MRGINRDVLARDAAARLRQASCREHRELWDRQEQMWDVSDTDDEAAAAAEPALALCDECPVLAHCAAWAEVDLYTGLAAGAGWRNGRRSRRRWRPQSLAI